MNDLKQPDVLNEVLKRIANADSGEIINAVQAMFSKIRNMDDGETADLYRTLNFIASQRTDRAILALLDQIADAVWARMAKIASGWDYEDIPLERSGACGYILAIASNKK